MSRLLTSSVFDLMKALLEEHDRASTGQLQVVPVLVQDLAVHLDLLRASFRHAGGVLLDASDLADGTRGVADPTLATVIKHALVPAGPDRPIEVVVDVRDSGETVTQLVGAPDDIVNPGFRTLKGVATALFDEGLRGATLAAIAYDEAPLGDDLQRQLWDLTTAQVAALPLGNLANSGCAGGDRRARLFAPLLGADLRAVSNRWHRTSASPKLAD